jgi:hypothetical protein
METTLLRLSTKRQIRKIIPKMDNCYFHRKLNRSFHGTDNMLVRINEPGRMAQPQASRRALPG